GRAVGSGGRTCEQPARPRRPPTMAPRSDPKLPGIDVRHGRACPSRSGRACECSPAYRARALGSRAARRLGSAPFADLEEALAGRRRASPPEAFAALGGPTGPTLGEAWAGYLAGAQAGRVLSAKTGRPYKPSTLHGYGDGFRLHVAGHPIARRPVAEISTKELQGLVQE